MRILFISAFYPPYIIGGWEQLVQDINGRLQARGHITAVLTSTHGVSQPTQETGVYRWLTLESDLYHYRPQAFLGHKGRLRRNLAKVEEMIRLFQPDVVFIHGMWNLSRGIAWYVEQHCPGRVVYYVANDWPYATDLHTAYWRDPAKHPFLRRAKQWVAPLALRLIAAEQQKFALDFHHVLCVSNAVMNDLARYAAIPRSNLHVVYNGVETNLFTPPAVALGQGEHPNRLSLLYAGSLVPHKGIHTAVAAVDILVRELGYHDVTLTIAGAGHPDYEARLHQQVEKGNLSSYVRFLGRVPREAMPALLRQHHVLVFPSIWEEPLARMMQEAMAAGLVVVGTVTGGSGELLVEGETGLTFAPDNASMLAQRIQQLCTDSGLRTRLAAQGRVKVLQQFDLCRMIDEIELYLTNVIQGVTKDT